MSFRDRNLKTNEKKYKLVEETPFPTNEEYNWIKEGYEKHYHMFH